MHNMDPAAYQHRVIDIEGGFYVKISRINEDVTIVRFVLSKEQPIDIAIPPNFFMIKKASDSMIESFREEFIVCWASNYELKYNDKTVLIIE